MNLINMSSQWLECQLQLVGLLSVRAIEFSAALLAGLILKKALIALPHWRNLNCL